MGPALGKIAMVLIAIALVRNVIGRHGHGDGESRRSGRRRMIAELHRELHVEDAAPRRRDHPADPWRQRLISEAGTACSDSGLRTASQMTGIATVLVVHASVNSAGTPT